MIPLSTGVCLVAKRNLLRKCSKLRKPLPSRFKSFTLRLMDSMGPLDKRVSLLSHENLSSLDQFEREHLRNHRCSLIHENENPCEGHCGTGCWTDWTELTICIFAEGILRLMAEVKQVVAVYRKACPDIHGRVACIFLEAAVCSCQ